MSTFKKCVEDGVAAGEITQEQADEYGNLFDDLVEQYNKQLGPGYLQSSGRSSADISRCVKKLLNANVKQCSRHKPGRK